MRVALTVAGSDSGGGAGIQADLKTFHALGVFGASAITCLTAQNPRRISAVQPVDPRLVREQMERVLEAFPVGAAKTGMLYTAAIVETVAEVFSRRKVRRLVVDPVMVAGSGALLLKKDALAALTRDLFPRAAVVTPNLYEAEVLARRAIRTWAELREAARALTEKFGVPFLVKGGHLPEKGRAVDVLFDGREFHEFGALFVPRIKTHGTGCAFSAAITAHLALGHGLAEAVRRAKGFVTRAIRRAVRIGDHHALNP
jgi:hydroxymethylpyrimidine/phosphomethylpyrimidine kinase